MKPKYFEALSLSMDKMDKIRNAENVENAETLTDFKIKRKNKNAANMEICSFMWDSQGKNLSFRFCIY